MGVAEIQHSLLQRGGESPSPASEAPCQGEDCAKLLTLRRPVDLSTCRRERDPMGDSRVIETRRGRLVSNFIQTMPVRGT